MEAQKKWRENGCPTSGPLFDEKRRLRIEVRKRVKHCAMQSERRHIQQRQKLFSSRAPHRFKVPGSHSMQSKCSKLMVNGNIVSAQSELLQTWAGHFEGLSKSCADSCSGIRVLEDKVSQLAIQSFSTYEGLLDTDFSAEEVATAVARLKTGKVPGPDRLTAEHLKAGGEAVITWLCTILNAIIGLEVILDALKVGNIVLIYKGGGKDPLDVHSYRGITLTSMVSKVLEFLLLDRLKLVLLACKAGLA